MNWLDRAMARGYEGIVFKSLASTYEPASRDCEWMKLKPDYVHDMGDEVGHPRHLAPCETVPWHAPSLPQTWQPTSAPLLDSTDRPVLHLPAG